MEALVLEYGVEVVMIALTSIFIVGLFKKAFKAKLQKVEKENRKAIYEVVSMTIVALLTTVWILMGDGGNQNEYIAKILASYGAMKVMYPLYENFRLRDLVQLMGKLLIEAKSKGGE